MRLVKIDSTISNARSLPLSRRQLCQLLFSLSLAIAIALSPVLARASEPPLPPPDDFVRDISGLLRDPDTIDATGISRRGFEIRLKTLRHSKSTELAIVTVPDHPEPERLSQELLETWRSGRSTWGQGAVLLCVYESRDPRTAAIAVSPALALKLPQAEAEVIVAEQVQPLFEQGNAPGAVLAAIEEFEARLPDQELPGSSATSEPNPEPATDAASTKPTTPRATQNAWLLCLGAAFWLLSFALYKLHQWQTRQGIRLAPGEHSVTNISWRQPIATGLALYRRWVVAPLPPPNQLLMRPEIACNVTAYLILVLALSGFWLWLSVLTPWSGLLATVAALVAIAFLAQRFLNRSFAALRRSPATARQIWQEFKTKYYDDVKWDAQGGLVIVLLIILFAVGGVLISPVLLLIALAGIKTGRKLLRDLAPLALWLTLCAFILVPLVQTGADLRLAEMLSLAAIAASLCAYLLRQPWQRRYLNPFPDYYWGDPPVALQRADEAQTVSLLTLNQQFAAEARVVEFQGWQLPGNDRPERIHLRAIALPGTRYQACPHCQGETIRTSQTTLCLSCDWGKARATL